MSIQSATNQATQPPLEDVAFVETHIRLAKSVVEWTDVGILIDEGNKATLTLLLNGNVVTSVLRFCLSVEDSVKAISLLKQPDGKILFGCWQSHQIDSEILRSQDEIDRIWQSIPEQIVQYSIDEVRSFFERMEEGSIEKGRNSPFSTATKRAVMLASHGRCMFEGCGEDLGFDQLTGTEGNFSYLAHNIASSESGPRGVVGLSSKLADDPSNILLLCDKHHRLIDKIAAVDYPAERLSQMRRDFCGTAGRLLIGLRYQPIPAFAVLWPFNQQVISPPSPTQIAQSLSTINARLDSQLNVVTENDEILRTAGPDVRARLMPNVVTQVSDRISMQSSNANHRAALFALGLMPPLIALGAKLGNKNEIIPMLRYRDGGQWTWPSETPRGKTYTILGLDELGKSEDQVVLILALTSDPSVTNSVAKKLGEDYGIKSVKIKAEDEYMGNGCIAHPKDGQEFMQDVQSLLHLLIGTHGATRIHLLPCASNAACIFFGQAYDRHHPDILIYDFVDNWMEPQMLLFNDGNGCVVTDPNS